MAEVIILGAGMSGVSAAKILHENGWDVTLLDKSRGVGGRMSTRRMASARADHGAQYFSAKSASFQKVVSDLETKGVIKPWQRFKTDSHVRYVGLKGMSSVPKSILGEISVERSQRIVNIDKGESGFIAKSEDGKTFRADELVVTIPSPQAIDLVRSSKVDQEVLQELNRINYEPCFALMIHTKSKVELAINKLEHGSFAWQMSNTEKGMMDAFSYTLHTSHEFSIEHLENPLEDTKAFLLKNLPSCFEGVEVVESQLHRWRFSIAQKRLDQTFLKSKDGIYFGGDGFGMGNVEGAFLSGEAIAKDLISQK